ncbi:MAG TPA: DinB family protein [Longimicrobium sp.]|nr:DinB family protein [Longimicrobium sp.]
MTDTAAAPVTALGLSFRELMAYTDEETRRWEAWFRDAGPAALQVSMGEAKWSTVGGLIYHVFMVERRYAERLLGESVTPYADQPPAEVDELFAVHREGRSRLERYVANARPEEWGEVITFETISAGTLSASKRKVVAHALMHGVRHWAQIATALRQAGHGEQWMHDVLMSSALG